MEPGLLTTHSDEQRTALREAQAVDGSWIGCAGRVLDHTKNS